MAGQRGAASPADRRTRILALGSVVLEDLSEAVGLTSETAPPGWSDFADAVAQYAFCAHALEQIMGVGVLTYAAAHLVPAGNHGAGPFGGTTVNVG